MSMTNETLPFGPLLKWGTLAPRPAPITDEFYLRMIANPDEKLPFAINFAMTERVLGPWQATV